jgi:hypothetical protein
MCSDDGRRKGRTSTIPIVFYLFGSIAVPGRYGKKGMFSPEQVAAIDALEPPVVKEMRKILMAAKEQADRGEFVTLKPWLTRRTTA